MRDSGLITLAVYANVAISEQRTLSGKSACLDGLSYLFNEVILHRVAMLGLELHIDLPSHTQTIRDRLAV